MFTLNRDQRRAGTDKMPIAQRSVITQSISLLSLLLQLMVVVTFTSSLCAKVATAQFVDVTSAPLGDVGTGRGVAWG